MARTEDGLVFIILFPGRVVLRSYIVRVLLVMMMVTAEGVEIVCMSNEIKLKCLEMDAVNEISFSTASHMQ